MTNFFLSLQNYRLRVANLFGKVSSVTVNQRSNRVVLVLNKDGTSFWSSLQGKRDDSKPNIADSKDPGDGIMDMMKKVLIN